VCLHFSVRIWYFSKDGMAYSDITWLVCYYYIFLGDQLYGLVFVLYMGEMDILGKEWGDEL
jgi:hypothetical protein